MGAKYKYPKDSSKKKYKKKESKEKNIKKRKNKSKEKKQISKKIPKRKNLIYYDSDNILDEESSLSEKKECNSMQPREEEDNNWIKLLEEKMNAYNVEINNSVESESESKSEKEIIQEEYKDGNNINNDKKHEEPLENRIEKEKKDKNNIITRKKDKLDLIKEIKIISEDTIVFNGKEFKNTIRINRYNEKRKVKKTIYKCSYMRKDEKLRNETGQKQFCNATIEYIEPGQNIKAGYFLKKEHSLECDDLYNQKKIKIENQEKNNKKELFIELCENIMNKSNIYDRRLFKEEFKNLYNDKNYKFDFSMNDNMLSNIITKWKNNNMRFTKASILSEIRDYNNRLILREYRVIPLELGNRKLRQNYLEYVIWANSENILRLKVSKNLFIDGTFHHPKEFYQLLIIMYKDIITNLKIPAFYVLMNNKTEILYNYIFESLLRIIWSEKIEDINVQTIVTDQEIALVNVVKKYFPKSLRISCLFHYKQDLMRNLRNYGLMKKKYKENSLKLLSNLGNLPFIYKGDIKIFEKECKSLSELFPDHSNFINNYFLENKKKYFEDQSLNYNLIPKDCRTNNFLENYNGYIKSKLGKHRIINWVNFLNFIKDESDRNITKLYDATTKNLKKMTLKEQINSVKQDIKPLKIFEDKENNILKNTLFKNPESSNNNKINNEELCKELYLAKMGLINIGESCYMNAALQILLHCKIFVESCFKYKNPFKKNITNSFIDIGVAMINKENDVENEKYIIKSFSPKNFYNEFIKKHPIFQNGQQDSIEFLRVLLNDISLENNRIIPSDYKELSLKGNNKHKLSKEFDDFYLSRENSIITEIFYIQMINTFMCKCGQESYSFQKLLDIPLLLPNDNIDISLHALIRNYLKSVKVNLKDECEKCKIKRSNITKDIHFNILNDIVIFSLQRFDPLLSAKNDAKLIFEDIIDLKEFYDNKDKQQLPKYKLFGIINHVGNLNYGHYYSYIKLENEWYEFNDSNVFKINNLPYYSSTVCALFYEKFE